MLYSRGKHNILNQLYFNKKEKVQRSLKKLKINLPCDPAIPLLDIYPKEMKTGLSKLSCTRPLTHNINFEITSHKVNHPGP